MNVICYLLLGNFSVETCLLLTKCFGIKVILTNVHSVKSVRIRSFSGPYFPTFRLNMERYGVSHRIQYKYGEIRTRETPSTDTFHAMIPSLSNLHLYIT